MSSFDISRTFKRIVREELGTDLPEIIRRNRTRKYGNSCATHDFCDANELMVRAFNEAQGCEFDAESDAHGWLWNKAWSMAVRDQFREIGPTPL